MKSVDITKAVKKVTKKYAETRRGPQAVLEGDPAWAA